MLMQIVFITGGSGFVGRSLVERLVGRGCTVQALARSDNAAATLRALGATPIRGDLLDRNALLTGMAGCDTVFHLAASVDFFADAKTLWPEHVTGTENVLEAARQAGVRRFVYLSASSVIMNGRPILNADETVVSDRIIDGYSQTKLVAEERVLAANVPGFQTLAIRPPLIWGQGDTSALPQMVAAARKGQLAFIGGGKHEFVTAHVQNVCEALLLAAESLGSAGETFFVTDGERLIFKDFIKAMLATQGIGVPDRSVPLGVARAFAGLMAGTWRLFGLRGQPPLYPGMVNALGLPFVVSDRKIRQRLHYQPIISVAEGLLQMQTKAPNKHDKQP
jgi:nucleoside-diphosphate-sugar epimerase